MSTLVGLMATYRYDDCAFRCGLHEWQDCRQQGSGIWHPGASLSAAAAAAATTPAAAATRAAAAPHRATPHPPCREDTLTQLFLTSLRRGKEAEACLAAKALGLHVTTLGASTASEGIYREVCRQGRH